VLSNIMSVAWIALAFLSRNVSNTAWKTSIARDPMSAALREDAIMDLIAMHRAQQMTIVMEKESVVWMAGAFQNMIVSSIA